MKIKKIHLIILFIVLAPGIVVGGLWAAGSKSQATPASPLPAQTLSTGGEGDIPREYRGKLQLFILAGQSNMSGRGEIPPEAESDPKVYVFGNDDRWRLATEPIDDPTGQVDKVSEDENAGFSPAMPFASAILERRPDAPIGLIPCAMDATTIHDWEQNASDSTLYGSCLKRVRAASEMGDVAGLLFFQGESDALSPRRNPDLTLYPDQWADKFSAFVEAWRSDLGQPDLPVVFAQIGTNTRPNRYPNWRVVQEQQDSVKLPFCKMIKTDDLALGDTVHFTTESYRVIGKRFAEAYLEISAGK
jgi:hypothetical protein